MIEPLTFEKTNATVKHSENPIYTGEAEAKTGAAIYSKYVLSVYDLFVLGFSNRFAWRCPSRLILDFYNAHVSARHLDIGVGTGYFLDKCVFPKPDPLIALADLNPNSLEKTAKRLRRYEPATHVINALKPFWIRPAGFESIGMNFLLHCLPGDLRSKSVVFQHVKPLLDPAKRSVVFGTTILGKGVSHNPLARALMLLYNAKGIFSNHWDSPWDLEHALKTHFYDYDMRIEGCVAFFVGRT